MGTRFRLAINPDLPTPPRYLNADLSLNHGAIRQAAHAEALARVHGNAYHRRALPARGIRISLAPLSFGEALDRAMARYTDIATGQQANELFFRERDGVARAEVA